MSKMCPNCKSVSRYRLKRPIHFKLVPTSSLYKCTSCSMQYLYIPVIHKSFAVKK